MVVQNPVPRPQEPQKPDESSPSESSAKTFGGRIKAYAWRITVVYLWIKILSAFLGFYASLGKLESSLIGQFIDSLSAIGFAPVNIALLSSVLKIGWILAITGFKLYEVLGLVIYIITFPVWAPVVTLFLFFVKKEKETPTASTTKRGLVQTHKSRSKWFVIFTSLLLAWFLLYGNANTTKQLLPGVILSGIFLILLVYRLFLRVKPEEDVNVNLPPFGWLSKLSLVAASAQRQRSEKQYKKKEEVQTDKKVLQFTRQILIRITVLLRRTNAQRRISLYVLGEYLFSLITVAAGAIFFWGLMIKAFYLTSSPLLVCLFASVSHFLPGIQPPDLPASFPPWISIGPASTAWVLFVLYIGPASSMLPERQRATIKGLSKMYKLYRTSVNSLVHERLWLRKEEKRLDS
jgi:hypothetical protein